MKSNRAFNRELWTSGFLKILIIELCFQLGSFVINPIVSSYVVSIGGPIVVGGVIAGLNSISALMSRPFVGAIADRFDRNKLLSIAAALSMSASLLIMLFPSVALTGACRVLMGVAFAIKSALIIAMTRLILPRELVGTGIGYMSLAYVLANAIGPAAGTELGTRFGYDTCFFISTIFFCVALLLLVSIRRESQARNLYRSTKAHSHNEPVQNDAKQALPHKRNLLERATGFIYIPALRYSIASGIVSLTVGSTGSLIVVAAGYNNVNGVSLFFVVAAISMALSRPIAGRICDKKGFLFAFAPSTIAGICSMLILASLHDQIMFVPAAFLYAIGPCTLTVIFQSECMRNVPAACAGKASNTFFIGPDLGMFLGPFIGGMLLAKWGAPALFGANAITLGILIIFVLTMSKLNKTA